MPVNVGRLRKPRQQAHLGIARRPRGQHRALDHCVLHLLASRLTDGWPYNVLLFFIAFGLVNLVLAVFNLIPIPPLDGSAIIERFVPSRHLRATTSYARGPCRCSSSF